MKWFDPKTGITRPCTKLEIVEGYLILIVLSPLLLLLIIKQLCFGSCWNGHKGWLSKGW